MPTGNPIPPNSPDLPRPSLETPIEVVAHQARFRENAHWGKLWNKWYQALLYLLSRPSLLSGAAADIPDATLYPENSRYWAKDTTTEYINLFSVPGDRTSAIWTAM